MWTKSSEKILEELDFTKNQIDQLSDKSSVGVGIITEVLLEAIKQGLVVKSGDQQVQNTASKNLREAGLADTIMQKAASINYSVSFGKKVGTYTVKDDEDKIIAKNTDFNHAKEIIEYALNVRNKSKKHTFLELQESPFNDRDVKGDIGMGVLFTMNENNLNYPENRKRIVKCVNMYDRLVRALFYWDKWARTRSGIDDEDLPRVHDTTMALLKEAE